MKLFKTLFDLVTLPIEIAKDATSLGGTLTGQEESYTKQRIEELDEDIND